MDELRLNLGCGKHPMEGWVNVDYDPSRPHGDVIPHLGFQAASLNVNLDRAHLNLPWADDSVDEVYSSHMIEHIRHPLPLMGELWRICKPDARATFLCPYGSSDDADENPTHVRRMFVGSWGFFGQPNYWREDYGYRADWVVEEIRLRITADEWKQADGNPLFVWNRVQSWRNVVKEMVATLRCQKPARPANRELQEAKTIIIEVLEPINAWENEVREVGRLMMGVPSEHPPVNS